MVEKNKLIYYKKTIDSTAQHNFLKPCIVAARVRLYIWISMNQLGFLAEVNSTRYSKRRHTIVSIYTAAHFDLNIGYITFLE